MRYIILSILPLLIIFPSLVSSQAIEVTLVRELMEKGTQPGIKVAIPEADRRPIKRQWKRRLKDFDNDDVNKSRKQVTGKEVQIPSISKEPLWIYTKLASQDQGVSMTVFFQTFENAYVAFDHPNYKAAKKLIHDFALAKAKEATKAILEDAQSNLEEHEKTMNELKNNAQAHKETIEECTTTIQNSEKKLKQIEQQRKDESKSLKEQSKIVENLKYRLNNLQ